MFSTKTSAEKVAHLVYLVALITGADDNEDLRNRVAGNLARLYRSLTPEEQAQFIEGLPA